MHKLCRVDLEHSKDLFDEIEAFADQLRRILPVQEIYLFGSSAKGDLHEGSDIDLLIIGDFKEKFFDRIGTILELTDLPIEPLVYTVEEFEEMKTSQNPFILEVLKTAIKK